MRPNVSKGGFGNDVLSAAAATTAPAATAATTLLTAAPAPTCFVPRRQRYDDRRQRQDAFFHSPLDPLTNVDYIPISKRHRPLFLYRRACPPFACRLKCSRTPALDADGSLLYDSATGHIFYDADGVGGVAAIQFLSVTAGTVLTSADFIVV